MTEQDIVRLLKRQNEYFNSGLTQSFESRLASLKTLKRAIEKNENELCKALKKDLGKRKKRVPTPLAQFAAKSFRSPSP